MNRIEKNEVEMILSHVNSLRNRRIRFLECSDCKEDYRRGYKDGINELYNLASARLKEFKAKNSK